MSGEGAVGTHGGVKGWRIHRLGKHWSKFCGKLGGSNRTIEIRSRDRGGEAGLDELVVGDAGMEMGDTQVGG